MNLNRVYLPNVGFFRPVRFKDGKKGAIRDFSGLEFQIGELIAAGAVGIAVDAVWRFKNQRFLPPGFESRVKYIDINHLSERKTVALVEPIATELDIEMLGLGGFSCRKALDDDLSEAFQGYVSYLPAFILGLDYELQIDINIVNLTSSVRTLRKRLRSSESRQTLAILEGVLKSYKFTSIDSLLVHSSAEEELVELFKRFLEDEAYMQLSEGNYNLGLQDQFKRAKTLISRSAKDLIKKPGVKELVDLSSKGITAATQIPAPSAESFKNLVNSKYLPPVVSLGTMMQKAKNQWAQAKPEVVIPPGLPPDFIDQIEEPE